MAGTKTTAQARNDEDDLLAAWEWCQETMRETDYIIGLAILPTARKGVWKLQARALNQVDGKSTSIAVQVTLEYPTSQYRRFSAAVMNALMQLDYELGQEALRRQA